MLNPVRKNTTRKNYNQIPKEAVMIQRLRKIDLNLVLVFYVIMQEENVTRAAISLSMSQPAVSNALKRLRSTFRDFLFVRHGRGIKPTPRAKALHGPALTTLISLYNELPDAGFDPKTSERTFYLSIYSPLDIRLIPDIINRVKSFAPHVQLLIKSYINEDIEHQLRYQETEFVISYTKFEESDFQQIPLFNDELVLAVSKSHPRINDSISLEQLFVEAHAVVALNKKGSFSEPYYESHERAKAIAYEGTDMNSVLTIVSQTYFVAIAPRWLIKIHGEALNLKFVELPLENTSRPCYLTWHESADRDKGHQWMKSLLGQFSL